MTDKDLIGHIDELIAGEHRLRDASAQSGGLDKTQRDRLRELEIQLDQCWDLLRQRRAKAEFGRNPDEAAVRPADQVEQYRG